MDDGKNSAYEVLSPWSDADPVSLHGINPRLENLDKKRIGLFCNSKRAAKLMLTSIENRLKQRFPLLSTTWYDATIPNIPEIESTNRDRFVEWVKGVDAVVLAVGD
ncbi:MAG TPA: hypothetical protein VHO84_14140 [Syntrophorhabdaceae bacterium]|nr:hypothetical protein [Syntrophorhabdaceae bacterium]